jgi:WS/DGAT/MGAT family acyltransferase
MGGRGYERLSAQDSTFVRFEAQGSHAHITAVAVFDAGSLVAEGRGLDVVRLREHIDSRLHLFPRYRKRMIRTPVQGHPVWVDDERFDIGHHVIRAGLPAPGGDDELKDLAGRLASQPLDLSRPAWQMWFVEGLDDGRFALVAKIHHSLVDGVSGVGFLTALLNADPEVAVEPGPEWEPEPAPSGLDYFVDGIAELGDSAIGAMQSLGTALRRPSRALTDMLESADGVLATVEDLLRRPADTPFNAQSGQQRRLEWLDLELDTLRDLRKHLDGTLNDVVLTIVAGAVRRRLRAREVELQELDFRVTIPVDTRDGVDDEALANKVSAWFISLPVAEADPRQRFAAIKDETRIRKQRKADRAFDLFMQLADWSGSSMLATRFADVASLLKPYNLLVTNVRGPNVPIYLLGAPLVAFYPSLPLFENQGLAMAVMTYRSKLHVGLTGDWDLLPDLADFGEDLRVATEELVQAAARSRR